MSKIVKSGTAEQPVYTESETTVLDSVVGGVMAPFNALAGSDNEFISVKDAAIGTVAVGAACVLVGDRFGAKIPILGGGRK